jgi:transposase-like protein
MGRFSTELFERYQRSERALVAALAEITFYRLPRQHHKHLKIDQHAGALQ